MHITSPNPHSTMQAIQIMQYAKNIRPILTNTNIPHIGDDEVLIKVAYAALNPLEILVAQGSLKLLYKHTFPLTLGSECSGIIVQCGKNVHEFAQGDRICAYLPLHKMGAFAEYVALHKDYIAKIPTHLDLKGASAIALAGLSAIQSLEVALNSTNTQNAENLKVAILGGSGSFGQIATPILQALGARVSIVGNARSKAYFQSLGVESYIDYKTQKYYNELKNLDCVIDTLGEVDNALMILREGGALVSLKNLPNKAFAEHYHIGGWRKLLFSLIGGRLDTKARKQNKSYHFVFVQPHIKQLQQVSTILEQKYFIPRICDQKFDLNTFTKALQLIQNGKYDGKIVITIDDTL